MFSDFWVEQGGYVTNVADEVTVINFLYSSYKYFPTTALAPYQNNANFAHHPPYMRENRKDGLRLKISTSNDGTVLAVLFWQTCGYANV